MQQDKLAFRVSRLEAIVTEGVPLEWQGGMLESGPLTIELAHDHESHGVLDYGSQRAAVEFHVLLRFPELAATFEALGLDAELLAPVRGVLRSEGRIEDDHRFGLHGDCELAPHELFPPSESAASVLPGH